MILIFYDAVSFTFATEISNNASVQVLHEAAISHSQVGIKWLCGLDSWNHLRSVLVP